MYLVYSNKLDPIFAVNDIENNLILLKESVEEYFKSLGNYQGIQEFKIVNNEIIVETETFHYNFKLVEIKVIDEKRR